MFGKSDGFPDSAETPSRKDFSCSDVLRLSTGEVFPAMFPKFVKLLRRDLPVHNWYTEFHFGRTTFEGSERCCQPVTVATEQNVAKVKCLDKGHPRITENEIKDSFNISSGSLNRIFRHHPGIWKRCTRWIPPPANRGTEEG